MFQENSFEDAGKKKCVNKEISNQLYNSTLELVKYEKKEKQEKKKESIYVK